MSTDDRSDVEANAGSGTGADGDTADLPPAEVGVGDGREKHVLVRTADGSVFEHGDVYLRYSETEFLVSADPEFLAAETKRYRKENLSRVEITQHHSMCFITTATAGSGRTLDSLRGFRADVMRPTRTGRALLRVYERVSPPIAATVDRNPDAAPTRLVRWLVERCGTLADDRREATTATGRASRSVALVVLYVVGVCLAALAHGWLRLLE
ncbi:CFI-box-CTERM domain-containing protein [Haloplanus halobius]|uniref:CFI-box-CTERM domain-containing protein n=1 Tax=Haloplanus halobius TaxID=2934938 RepID=UPI00200F0772|nr:CFI-box-CTERM domain-containing protein [Haloplanus sp. XH21]